MAQIQSTNLIRIDCAKLEAQDPMDNGDDPVLLSELKGTEGFSQGFSYECTMLRNKNNGEIGLEPMVNSLARVGMRVNTPDGIKWICRTGVIDYFEEAGVTTKFGTRFYHTYKARIIPPLDMMIGQKMYRIFENTTPKKILETVLDSIPHMKGNGKVAYNLHNLELSEWYFKDYYIDHRIQFGEDTFSFLSRLMAEFGIWYYYGYEWLAANDVEATRKSVACSPIRLFGVTIGKSDARKYFFPIDYNSQPEAVNEAPGDNSLGGVNRSFNPYIHYFEVGDFNQLKPSAPRLGKAVSPPAENSDKQSWSRVFPASLNCQKDADEAAKYLQGQATWTKTMIVGSSANPAFAVGRTFVISKDDDNPTEEGREFVISSLAFHAYDDSIGQNAGTTAFGFINGWLWEPIKGAAADFVYWSSTLIGAKPPDWAGAGDHGNISISLAAAGLNNMWKNQIQYSAQNTQYNNYKSWSAFPPNKNTLPYASQPTNLGAATYFEAGALAQIVNVLAVSAGLIGKPLSELWEAFGWQDSGKYGNSFTAQNSWIDQPVLPKVSAVIASGPQLAVVIGERGALKGNGTGQGEDITGIYADDLGRVRIRFPWDPGPPVDPGKASPPAATKTPPLAYGENTCWVRVSQPWASRGYGAQFLPRIGDEVIVDFIAGDPDRPIVIGRVYNADHSTANMPFPKDRKADPRSVPIKDDYLLDPKPPTSSKFTRSGVKTTTVDSDSGEVIANKYHLLRFDDDSSYNQVLVRSQGRLDITAFDNRYETIWGDTDSDLPGRHLTIGGIMQTGKYPKEETVGYNSHYIAKVYGNYHLHVGDPQMPYPPDKTGNRFTLIEQNDEIQVKRDSNQAIGGNWSTSTGGQATIDASSLGGKIVLNATEEITLSVGSSVLVVSQFGISIFSPAGVSIGATIIGPIPTGTPPVPDVGSPPIDPAVTKPKDPKQADDGTPQAPSENTG